MAPQPVSLSPFLADRVDWQMRNAGPGPAPEAGWPPASATWSTAFTSPADKAVYQESRPGAPSRAGPATAGMDEEMSTISDAVVDDLTFDPDVDASGITVKDGDGDVVLAGSVPSYPQCVEAAAVAR